MFAAQLFPPIILLFCDIFFAVSLIDRKFPFETSWERDKSLMACMIFVFKMHNEVNLLAIPSGGDLKKYALKVFSQLFTREEMAAGILEPSREKATGKEVLDPHRTNLLKSNLFLCN